MKGRNTRLKYGSTGSLALKTKPPSYAEMYPEIVNSVDPEPGKAVICSVCHRSGGTLIKDGKGGYKHVGC